MVCSGWLQSPYVEQTYLEPTILLPHSFKLLGLQVFSMLGDSFYMSHEIAKKKLHLHHVRIYLM